RHERPIPHLLGHWPGARRHTASRAGHTRCISGARGRHQLQAAHTKNDGVLPRRPAQPRRGWYAESTGVRPGILWEEWRWRGGREANRAPVQKPGLPARRIPRRPAYHSHAAADDRYVLAATDTGRVLFLAPL